MVSEVRGKLGGCRFLDVKGKKFFNEEEVIRFVKCCCKWSKWGLGIEYWNRNLEDISDFDKRIFIIRIKVKI